MTMTVFEVWGVCSCGDFGEIVFNLVESGVLAKTEKDSRADFQNGYDFEEAFRKPFLPAGKPGTAPSKKPHKAAAKVAKVEGPTPARKPAGEPEKVAAGTEEAAGEADMGYLVANTIPWAKVLVDGKDTGKTTPVAPRQKIALKPGRHKVTFVADGKEFHFPITVTAGQITRLIKKLPLD
jgi:hypothetical protein